MKPPSRKSAPAPPRLSAPLWHYLLLCCFPALLTLINSNWAFQNLGHMDAWYYFGDFRHFPRFHLLAPDHIGNYPNERIPWIFPGLVLVRLFGHVNGVFLLHCLVLVACLLLTHYILLRTTDYRTALAGAVLLGAYPCFIGATGWDYVDSMQMLLLAASIALLVKAARSGAHATLYVFLSGAAWSGILYLFLPWAAFTPIYFWLAVSLTAPGREFRRAAPRIAGILLLAGAFATAALWAIYLLLGAHGFFYRLNLMMALSLSNVSSNPWISATWYREPTWLIVPVLALGLAALWSAASRFGLVTLPPERKWLLWFYLLCFAVMVGFTVHQTRLLASDHHMSVIIPATYVALGITVLRVPAPVRPWLFYTVVALAGTVSLSTLASPGSFHALLHWQAQLGGAVLITALAAFSWWRHRQGHALCWAAIVLTLAAMSTALVPAYPGLAWKENYHGRESYERVARAIDVVMQRLPQDALPTFWFDNESDPLTGEFRGVMCAFLAHGQSQMHFPALDLTRPFQGSEHLIVMTRDRAGAETARAVLARAGMPSLVKSQDLVQSGDASFWLAELQLLPAQRP